MDVKKPATVLDFRDDPELFVLVNQYRKQTGWTWKRLFLIGVAETIAKQGDNPDLVMRLADYLTDKR